MGPLAIPSGLLICGSCVAWDLKMGSGGERGEGLGEQLAEAWLELAAAGLAEGTGGTYMSKLRGLRVWGREQGLKEADLFPRNGPMSEMILAGFLRAAAVGWKPGTFGPFKAAVADWHRAANLGGQNPLDGGTGALVYKGARRLAGKANGTEVKQAKAMSVELLVALLAWLRKKEEIDPARAPLYRRDAAWLVLGFCGLLRRSELGGLTRGDVDMSGPGMRVKIAKSKTDQEGVGQWVYYAATTSSGIRVKETVARWLGAGRRGGAKEPLFTKWHRRGRYMTAEAVQAKGRAMVEGMRRHIQGMFEYYGMQTPSGSYSGHSLRRGGATALFLAGWSPEEIQKHGRWSSDCYKRYLERTGQWRRSLSGSM